MKNRPERTVIRYNLQEPVDRSISLSDRVESARRHAEIAAATFRQARKCRRFAWTATSLERATIDASRWNANVARESQRAAGWYLPPSLIHKGKARSKANGRARRH